MWDQVGKRRLQFVTIKLDLCADQITDLYRDRWQVELLFKRIKRNLRITSFVGTTANAVKIQIFCTLCAVLLVEILRARAVKRKVAERPVRVAIGEKEPVPESWTASRVTRASMAFSIFIALLRLSLFAYRDLMEWLANPFPDPKRDEQRVDPGSLF